jgi:hypothetical protein
MNVPINRVDESVKSSWMCLAAVVSGVEPSRSQCPDCRGNAEDSLMKSRIIFRNGTGTELVLEFSVGIPIMIPAFPIR